MARVAYAFSLVAYVQAEDGVTMFKGRPKKRSRQKNIKKDTRPEVRAAWSCLV